jgi:hypothetical protein
VKAFGSLHVIATIPAVILSASSYTMFFPELAFLQVIYKPDNMKKILLMAVVLTSVFTACKKDKVPGNLRYFEIGTTADHTDWRDTSFIVATADPDLIAEIAKELNVPVKDRRIVNGKLLPGDGGYNRNATHSFRWHFQEDDWHFTDMSIEIFDGRPHADLDVEYDYWMNTVKRFSPWSSYVRREVNR